LGYIPKQFRKRLTELGRANGKDEKEIEEGLNRINLGMIKHNFSLYGEWLKDNRRRRKERGLNTHHKPVQAIKGNHKTKQTKHS
jgi:hypothetical protein